MKRRILVLVLLPIVAVVSCCKTQMKEAKKRYDRPLPPGRFALRKITDPLEIPDFTQACLNLTDLRKAIDHSLSYMHKPSSKQFYPSGQITHNQALESLKAFAEMLDSGLSGSQLNLAIRERFDVYISIGCDDMGTVLFTGYYTPIFVDGAHRSLRLSVVRAARRPGESIERRHTRSSRT
jgi:membrane-bound lytic murein transglycosylase A